VAQGRTREEAQVNLKKTIASYLSVIEELPDDDLTGRRRREAVRA
jgi:predicted RNase H-like HicB family nuclease